MDRQKIAFAAMQPLDIAVGAAVNALKVTGSLDKVSDSFYAAVGVMLKQIFRDNLTVEGLDKVPKEGGVIFASNHQSWADVEVLGASCPRRIRFLAKSEFQNWPVLRHLITLSDSPFIRRGGDQGGIAAAVRALREGKALVCFPEGTIPGEENLGRHQVEPDTGLLRGRTGAVRMAIEARVPIVPVGVSGTGKVLPPEVYPRLELLELPRPAPVTVRFGDPISFEDYYGREVSYGELRTLTKKVMRAISALVDHERDYVPMRVPVPELPRYDKVGVLLLHGFTSSVRTIDGLVPYLREAGIPHRIPVLRGHGTHFTDLEGVTARDWYDDAEEALLDLAKEVDKVIVVGLSMGGLVAINLGIRHPDKVAAVVSLAASMRFRDPLTAVAPLLAKIIHSWPAPNAFNDLELKIHSQNYPRFTTDAFAALLNYAHETESRLSQLKVPICVLQSKADQVVDPVAANIIYRDVASEHREIHWFERSGHELGQDLEKEAVFKDVMEFINKFKK